MQKVNRNVENKGADVQSLPETDTDEKLSNESSARLMRMGDTSEDPGIIMGADLNNLSMMDNDEEADESEIESLTYEKISNNDQVLLDVPLRTKIDINEPLAAKIAEQFKPYLENIIKKSNPSGEEDVSQSLKTTIPKWRENIKNNLEKLVNTQTADHGREKVYSMDQAEYEERKKAIGELESEKKALKQEKKQKKRDARSATKKELHKELKPKEIKQWWQLFKHKTQKQKDIEGEGKTNRNAIETEFDTKKDLLDLLIKYLTDGVPKDVDINKVLEKTPDYKKYFNEKNLRTSLNDLRGVLEGPIDKYSRDKKETDINPYQDFKVILNKGAYNERTVYFEFKGVNSIEDIMPVFTPRAQENIIEASKNDNASDNPYRKLYDVGQQIPANGDDLNNYLSRAGLPTIPNANLYPDQNSIQKYLFDLDKNVRARYLNAYRQGKYNEVVSNFTASDRERMEQRKRDWETNQTTQTRNDLNTLYATSYGLSVTEDAWKTAHSKDMKDNPDQYEPGYNKEGEATYKTANDFAEWLKKFPPYQLKWQGSEFVPAMEKPVQSSNSNYDNFKRQDDEYIRVQEKARDWTKKLNDINKGTLKPKGWEIDTWKQDALSNLSMNLINPQKWQTGAELNWEREQRRQEGGLPVNNPPLNTTVDKASNVANTYSVVQSGVYRTNDQVRDPKYDDKSGYLPNPQDQSYLGGFNAQNPLFSDPDKLNFQIKSAEQVSDFFDVKEKINWLINYKVEAYEEK